jgi:ABC-type antimicrobial peptide transport system permease subunit
LSGHAIDGPNQMVLGTATLAQLHKHVGDTVVSSLGLPKDAPRWVAPARFRIVGSATFPTIGFVNGENTSMNTGVLFSNTPEPRNAGMLELRRLSFGPLNGPTLVVVKLRGGANVAAARARLQRIVDRNNANTTLTAIGWTTAILPVQRPAEIVNYRSMGQTPALLAIALATGAVVALALTLTASVRRRRRDLALFKTLGFTRRQLVGTVAAQASVAAIIGTFVGVPVGVLTGRWLWTHFAHSISVIPQPTVPTWSIAIVAVGALVLANLVAAVPGLLAARTPSALLLRAE